MALEPTGHYWFNLADYLRDHDVKLVLVAPQHVKHSKEMDDNTQTKNDRKDPLVIAKLVTEGRYMFPYIPEDIYAELRVAFNRRCDCSNICHRQQAHPPGLFERKAFLTIPLQCLSIDYAICLFSTAFGQQ